jgi:type II secretory pathway pseudopilin PulG
VRPARNARRGVVLLEAIVALAILATAAAALVVLAASSVHAVRQARSADDEMRAASAFMDVVALWPRADLDRHLGDRDEGPWRLRVQRPTQVLYTVALLDSTARRELLRSVLYRPEELHAAP